MNTLNKEVTRRFYKTDEGFEQLRKAWKKHVDTGESIDSAYHLIYAVLRGKDWRKGFTPVTNSAKLANGYSAYDEAVRAYYYMKSFKSIKDVFGDIFSEDVLEQIISVVNAPCASGLPDEAYKEIK